MESGQGNAQAAGAGIVPGFRFYPTEEELVGFYLVNKLDNDSRVPEMERIIPVLDVYAFHPRQLPREPCVRDPEQWFFYSPRNTREAQGGRPTRLTPVGFWKATGSPSLVHSNGRPIGTKKTMVFYEGRAPNGIKMQWKMHQYKALEDGSAGPDQTPKCRNEFSLCRVYVKGRVTRAFDRRPSVAPAGGEAASTSTAAAADGRVDSDPYQENSGSLGRGEEEAMDMEMELDPIEDLDWDILETI